MFVVVLLQFYFFTNDLERLWLLGRASVASHVYKVIYLKVYSQ